MYFPHSTVRIQSYSFQEIQEKHLTKMELTDLVNEAILVLENELRDGYLTNREFDDYINLFRSAAERIFKDEKHSEFREEVDRMTKPLIELPSVREKRMRAENDALRNENHALRARSNAELTKKDAELAEKERQLAEKNAELARIKELLEKYNIAIAP